jgi:hypothetical protein
VAVMGAIPKPAADVPNCLSAHIANAAGCEQPVTAVYDQAGVQSEQAAVTAAGGSYIDTQSWFCQATCAVVVGNLLVYRDDNHLTTTYAAWLSPVVGAALDQGPLRHPPN